MADPLLIERQKIYGQELGEHFHYLLHEWADLWLSYKQYTTLFGTNRQRVSLLNKASPFFSFNVERHFWNACILGVCRITDPKKSAGKRNLSLQWLPDLITEESLRNRVTHSIDRALDLSSFHRERRNKILSHNDYEITSKRGTMIEEATRKKMRLAIEAVHKPLSIIATEIADTDIRPEVLDSQPDELNFLHMLYVADVAKSDFEKKYVDEYLNLPPEKRGLIGSAYPDWLSRKRDT